MGATRVNCCTPLPQPSTRLDNNPRRAAGIVVQGGTGAVMWLHGTQPQQPLNHPRARKRCLRVEQFRAGLGRLRAPSAVAVQMRFRRNILPDGSCSMTAQATCRAGVPRPMLICFGQARYPSEARLAGVLRPTSATSDPACVAAAHPRTGSGSRDGPRSRQRHQPRPLPLPLQDRAPCRAVSGEIRDRRSVARVSRDSGAGPSPAGRSGRSQVRRMRRPGREHHAPRRSLVPQALLPPSVPMAHRTGPSPQPPPTNRNLV